MNTNHIKWIKDTDIRVYDANENIIDVRRWKFNRRNINKIAYEYDAEIVNYQHDICFAKLRDRIGRILFVASIGR